jgi:hypothetical protein
LAGFWQNKLGWRGENPRWARKQSTHSDISADSLSLKQLNHRSSVLVEYQSPIFVSSPYASVHQKYVPSPQCLHTRRDPASNNRARFKKTRSQRSRTFAGASSPPAGFGKGADSSSQAPAPMRCASFENYLHLRPTRLEPRNARELHS